MRFSDIKGVGLVLLAVIVSLWLSLTGQLALYIHPRYIVFTTILSAVALLYVVFGFKYLAHHHNTGDSAAAASLTTGRRLLAAGAAAICLFGSVSLLVVKPAALTSATASQRGINAAAATVAAPGANVTKQLSGSPLFAGNDYSGFTIKDWAGLLVQTADVSFFAGKNVAVTGFVVADQNDSKNVFYISRFVITCCAVDARPIGLAVYAPGWQAKYKNDDWVNVTGSFAANPSMANQDPVAIIPSKLMITKQPDRAYDY